MAVMVCGLFLLEPMLDVNGFAQKRKKTSGGAGTRALSDEQQIQNVLTKLTFGARPGDFERVRQTGVAAFIDEQLLPDSIDDSALDKRLAKLPTLMLSTPAIAEQYNPPKPVPSPSPQMPAQPTQMAQVAQVAQTAMPAQQPQAAMPALSPTPAAAEQAKPVAAPQPATQPSPKPTPPPKNPQQVVTELQRAELLRAVYSQRQLNEVIVNFWENHFSIFQGKDTGERLMLTSFDRDVIRPFAMGRFRDLLGATAHSPAMLFYLDNWQSTVARHYPAANGKPARTTGGLNENYARELMELHTMGVDGGYTQKDVQEVARCFTGWTIRKPNEEGLALFNPAAHDNGEKLVLGQKISSGGGISDGERVLDILAKHPSTARFIATKLARRFISDTPPQSVIDRAADAFLKTDGSIRETLKSIITSPEFRSNVGYKAKTRSPFEYVAAALRAVDAETDADRPALDWINRMGQQSFGRMTPDGYPDRADQWLTTGTLLERLNFANALVTNRIKGTQFDAGKLLTGVDLDNPELVSLRFVHIALGDDLAPTARKALEGVIAGNTAVGRTGSSGQAQNVASSFVQTGAPQAQKPVQPTNGRPPTPPQIAQILTLVIGSPDFQRR
jgi:uncharacterized protein (DUF1800 family)